MFPMLGSGRQTDPRNSLTSQPVLIRGPQIKVRERFSQKQNKTNKNEVPEERHSRLTSDLCTHTCTGTLPHLLWITATKLYKQTGKQMLLKDQKAGEDLSLGP